MRDGVQRQPPLKWRQLVQPHTEPAREQRMRAEQCRPVEGGRSLHVRAAGAYRKVPYGHAGLPRRAGRLVPQADLRHVRCPKQRLLQGLRKGAQCLKFGLSALMVAPGWPGAAINDPGRSKVDAPGQHASAPHTKGTNGRAAR